MSEELEKTEVYWLSKIFLLLDRKNQPNVDSVWQISALKPYVIDYQERDYVYAMSLSSFQLTIEDYGTIPVVAGQWVALWLPTGTRCFAQGVSASSPVVVFVRCSNKTPGFIPN